MSRAFSARFSRVHVLLARSLALSALVLLAAACGKADDSTAPAAPSASATTFSCPMDCEHGKTYPTKGQCPVCKMDLEQSKEGHFAHADHKPKHGGQFIMASDNFHHLEGTLPEPRKFVLWLYDNFTKPLAVGKTTAKLAVMTKARTKGQKAEYADLDMTPGAEASTLVATLPENVPWPVQARAVVTFEGLEPLTFSPTTSRRSRRNRCPGRPRSAATSPPPTRTPPATRRRCRPIARRSSPRSAR